MVKKSVALEEILKTAVNASAGASLIVGDIAARAQRILTSTTQTALAAQRMLEEKEETIKKGKALIDLLFGAPPPRRR
jgi:hypothetical protein